MRLVPVINNSVTKNVMVNRVKFVYDPTDTLGQYLQSKREVLRFDTGEGKFEIINNQIYKLKECSKYEEYSFSNEISFQHDNNDCNDNKEVFYIPFKNQHSKVEVSTYKLSPKSIVTLKIEKYIGPHRTNEDTNNKDNKDNKENKKEEMEIYFETTEQEITESVKEDLITFLSFLKLYK